MDEDTHPLLLLLPLVSFIQIKPTHGEQFCATVRGWAVCRLYEKATEHMNGPPRIDMHLIYSDCGAVPRGKALRRVELKIGAGLRIGVTNVQRQSMHKARCGLKPFTIAARPRRFWISQTQRMKKHPHAHMFTHLSVLV